MPHAFTTYAAMPRVLLCAACVSCAPSSACVGTAWAQNNLVGPPLGQQVGQPFGHPEPQPSAIIRTILDDTLTPREARILSLDTITLRAIDARTGSTFTLPRERLIALLPSRSASLGGVAGLARRRLGEALRDDTAGLGQSTVRVVGPAIGPNVAPNIGPARRGGEPARTTPGSRGALSSPANQSPVEQGWITTVSGAYVHGRVNLLDSAGDTVVWSSDSVGSLAFTLDDLRAIALRPKALSAQSLADLRGSGTAGRAPRDAAYLTNGDVLQGFVELVHHDIVQTPDLPEHAIRVTPEGGAPSIVDFAGVAAMSFSNPLAPVRGACVWSGDGTILPAEHLAIAPDGSVRFTTPSARVPGAADENPEDAAGVLGARTVHITPQTLSAVSFDRATLRALWDFPLTLRTDESPRRWTPPPGVIDAQAPLAPDVLLQGPIVCEWSLPAGSARIAGSVEMPTAARVFGDCEVLLFVLGKGQTAQNAVPSWKVRVSGAEPSAAFNVPVPASVGEEPCVLRLEIRGGEGGPVQDVIRLRKALVLLRAAPKNAGAH